MSLAVFLHIFSQSRRTRDLVCFVSNPVHINCMWCLHNVINTQDLAFEGNT